MNKYIDISNVILDDNELVLRSFKESDLSDLYEYAKVPGVGEMAGWHHHESIDETKMILNMFIENKNVFAITYNNKVIGSVGIELYNENILSEFDDLMAREIGFVLSKDYWGMGIMKRAVTLVLDYLFNKEGLDLAVCGHYNDNNQSKRVQEKIGFKPYKMCEYKDKMGIVHRSTINILKKEDFNK